MENRQKGLSGVWEFYESIVLTPGDRVSEVVLKLRDNQGDVSLQIADGCTDVTLSELFDWFSDWARERSNR